MSKGTVRLDSMIAGTFVRSTCGEALQLPLVCEYRGSYVKCIHTIDERFINLNGTIFGGYLAAVMDQISAHVAMTVIPDDKMFATAELSISYLRPCLTADAPFVFEGDLVNQSRRSYHIETTMRRPDGKLIAKAHSVQAIFDRDAR